MGGGEKRRCIEGMVDANGGWMKRSGPHFLRSGRLCPHRGQKCLQHPRIKSDVCIPCCLIWQLSTARYLSAENLGGRK